MLTIHDYIGAYIPRFIEIPLDPEVALQELRVEADALALQVGLTVNPEGRYAVGLWDAVMSR